MFKKILIICAHPDDELLGCGGLIYTFKEKCKIKIIYTCKTYDKRNIKKKSKYINRKKSAKELSGYLKLEKPVFLPFPGLSLKRNDITKMSQSIFNEIKKFRPDSVFTHCIDDLHHDHRSTAEAVMIATRPSIYNSFVKKIFSFEVPSASEKLLKKNKSFNPTFFIDISSVIEKKIFLIKKFYKEEIKQYPSTISKKGIINLSQFRGNNMGIKNAEAFEIIKFII